MAYCKRADIEAIFGTVEVKKWADKDEDGVVADITARITEAIAFADDKIDTELRGGPFAIPFTTVFPAIKRLSAVLAGVWLYEIRGIQDFDQETGQAQHRLSWHKTDAARQIKLIRSGVVRLENTQAWSTPEVPTET